MGLFPVRVITVEQALIRVIQPEATQTAGSHQKKKMLTRQKLLQQKKTTALTLNK